MQRLKNWAGGLHIGQLVMAIIGAGVIGLPGAFISAFFSLVNARDWAETWNGNVCCDARLTVQGTHFRWTDTNSINTASALERIERIRKGADSMSAAGNPYSDAEIQKELPKILPLEQDFRLRAEDARQRGWWTFFSVLTLLLTLPFAFLTLAMPWWWFGARRSPAGQQV